jgi:hypothetical protein
VLWNWNSPYEILASRGSCSDWLTVVSAVVFAYAKENEFFANTDRVDYSLLKTVKEITSHLEVQVRTYNDWERAIIDGYRAWKKINENEGGIIRVDMVQGLLRYEGTK